MADYTLGLTEPLRDYINTHATREHPVLAQCRQDTAKLANHVMQISPEQGQFMALLVSLTQSKRIVEVGTFTGYSALAMALALPENGKLIALDSSQDYTDQAQTYWRAAGVADKIELRLGDAKETMSALAHAEPGGFDMVFIDANKLAYPHYYEQALILLKPGGLIAIDNTLQSGRVADDTHQDKITCAIRAFNDTLHQDERIHLSLVPIGDGVTLCVKK